MKTARILLAFLTAVLATGMGTSQAAFVIYSNSFEVADSYPDPGPGPSGSTGPSLSGQVRVFDENNYLNPATDGTQYAVFNYADGASGGSFTSPNIATVNSGIYSLAFDFGNFSGLATSQQLQITVTDTITTSLLLNQTVTDSSAAFSSVMSPYSFNFTGAGNPVSVQFLDTTAGAPGNASDGLLDHIQVSFVIPESGVVMLLAVGGLLLWRRR